MRETAESERTCIVTRRREPPEAMIRFVRAPDGALTPDIRARLPGRGVWVTGRADLLAKAVQKQAFGHGLKAKVAAPADLVDQVDRLLEADCLQMLAMANKAGLVTAGFGKVGDALEKRAVAALVEAADGGADGLRKVMQIARRAAGPDGETPPCVAIFTSMQLDLALGRTNVIHAALARGAPAEGFLARCRRLADYRAVALDAGAKDDHLSGDPNAGARGADIECEAKEPKAAQDRKLDE